MTGLNGHYYSNWLIAAGSSLLVLGIFLVLVKLLMFVAEYAGPGIALAGLILLVIGMVMRR